MLTFLDVGIYMSKRKKIWPPVKKMPPLCAVSSYEPEYSLFLL